MIVASLFWLFVIEATRIPEISDRNLSEHSSFARKISTSFVRHKQISLSKIKWISFCKFTLHFGWAFIVLANVITFFLLQNHKFQVFS
jgi:hypothetical protein